MKNKYQRLLNKIGYDIAMIRKRKGWTQKQLAKRMGTAQQYISRMECGGVHFTVKTLLKVAFTLDKTLVIEFV